MNAVLSENWETKSARLGKLTEGCEPDAVKLSVALLATTNLEALSGHHYSLQVAMGRCPQLLLPITPDERVSELCSVSAYIEANPKGNPLRELSRRRAKLHKFSQLEESTKGQACIKAYEEARQALPR